MKWAFLFICRIYKYVPEQCSYGSLFFSGYDIQQPVVGRAKSSSAGWRFYLKGTIFF